MEDEIRNWRFVYLPSDSARGSRDCAFTGTKAEADNYFYDNMLCAECKAEVNANRNGGTVTFWIGAETPSSYEVPAEDADPSYSVWHTGCGCEWWLKDLGQADGT